MANSKNASDRRKARIRRSIRERAYGKPRLAVHRTSKQIYAQIIDDIAGKTLVSASSGVKELADKKIKKTEQAKLVGKLVAERALEAGITNVVFDRGGFLYHGRIKSLADAAREGGLKF